MGKQNPSVYDFSNVQVPFRSTGVDESNTQQVEQNDYFLRNFKTPSDIEEYKNYILSENFPKFGVESPYISTGEYRSRLDPNAKMLDIDVNDTPEIQAGKEIRNRLIRFNGKLPEAGFMHKVIGGSMIAGWTKLLTGKDDFMDLYGGFSVGKDGYKFKGQKLNLDDEQLKLVSDFITRSSGQVTPATLWDKIALTTATLAFELPLLILSGGIAGGIMKGAEVTAALSKSTDIAGRLLGQVVQQSVNFSLLGIPQTVESLKEDGVDGALNSVWHNVQMGTLAAATGGLGFAIGKGVGKIVMKRTPVITEELSALGGSFGFGYLSTKITGGTTEDAVATGLAFAATHFTNPSAYGRAIKEISNKNVKIVTESHDKLNGLNTPNPDYFVENKDGKLEQIDAEAFGDKGIIRKLNVEPLEINEANKNKFMYYNELVNHYSLSYGEALADVRKKKKGGELYKRWLTETDANGDKLLPSDYVENNNLRLRQLAELTVASVAQEKLSKTFSKWQLPQDEKLSNELIRLSNGYKVPYTDLKKFVITNISEYFANPADVISRINENPMVATELNSLLKVAGDVMDKIAKANYAQELLSKSGLPAAKQLAEGKKPEPFDLTTEAERIQTGVERGNLKAQTVDGTLPPSELKPDKYVFYDFNGELVPMVKSKGKLTIAGTNIEIPFETVKDKVKTKAEVVKEAKDKASKKTEVKPIDAETVYVKQALADAGGVKKLSADEMFEVIRRSREEYKAKNPEAKPVEPVEIKPEEVKVENKPENASETTPISNTERIKPEVVQVESELTNPQTTSKSDFEFEKSKANKDAKFDNFNLLNLGDKVANDEKFLATPEGRKETLDVVNDIKDKAEKQGVPKADIRDFTMLVLKKVNKLSAGKVASMMRLDGSKVTDDMVENLFKKGRTKTGESKAKIYGELADKFAYREEPAFTEPEAETGIARSKDKSVEKELRELTGDDELKLEYDPETKDYVETGFTENETGTNREITRTTPETKMKNALSGLKELAKRVGISLKELKGDEQRNTRLDAIDDRLEELAKITDERDLTGKETNEVFKLRQESKDLASVEQKVNDEYTKLYNAISGDKFLSQGESTEAALAMLNSIRMGKVDTEGLREATMFEINAGGRRLTVKELEAAIAKGNKFWNQFGVTVVSGHVPQEAGKPLRAGMFEFNFADGTGKITIDTTFGRTTTMPHENMHSFMMLAAGKDRPQLDILLKKYGWNGNITDKSFVDAQERVIKEVQNALPRSPLVQRIVEGWEKIANYFEGNGWYSEAQLFRKLAAGQIEVARYKDSGSVKFYEEIAKPFDPKDGIEVDMFERALREQQKKYGVKGLMSLVSGDNKLSSTFMYVKGKTIQSFIQSNNYPNQVGKNGEYIHPDEKTLYDMTTDLLVNRVPYERNTILNNENGWGKGRWYRDLDDNSKKDLTNRNDMANKINQYHNDIYWGKADAPSVKENETMQEAHTRIGKEIGLSDRQIGADWKTQEAYREANNRAYNGTIDMYANLKDFTTKDYIVANGLNRKKLNEIFNISPSVSDDLAYKQAKEIVNSNPEKRFEVAVALANESPFYERNNPFYHSDVRPSNPKFWVISGYRQSESETSDRFLSYAENEKQFKQIRKEWSDKGYVIDQEYNIGKEIADKQYNKLSVDQLINLANAGHIPINDKTIQALLEATKAGRFEQHNLEKKYVPGMHGSAKEYERQLTNFVDEAVSASTRRYALDTMRDFISERKATYNIGIKDPALGDAEKNQLRLADEWMTQYYNQVSQSDVSVVDGLRELATSYYIGFKPSFAAMQMFAPLQMALPEAIKEAGGAGAGIWGKSLSNAWHLAYEIRARQKGETIGKVDDELYRIYDKLDKMRKMGATGIRELTGEAGDIELHYGSDMYKGWKTFIKIGNMAGAMAEKYTRLQSLNMWYEIGKNKGLQGESLEKFILTKHDEVMSLWGASGRPVIGQSKELGVHQQKAIKGFMKSFYTFKTYTMANLGQYDRLMRNREWGALGVKMAIGTGLHGITNFPLMATFYSLYNLLSDDDLEYGQIKALDDMGAGLLGRGISSVLPIDLQRMLDERTAFVGDSFAETSSKSAEGKILEVMMGAPYGVPKDILEGSQALYKYVGEKIDDDMALTEGERLRAKKNWNKILPLTARNILNAMNMKDDGIQVRGRELVKAEDITAGDIVWKVLGFNPRRIADAYEKQFSGFPAKWSRINGRIDKLKAIRKEISVADGYTDLERASETQSVAKLIREAQVEQSELRKTADYRSAIRQGLIKP